MFYVLKELNMKVFISHSSEDKRFVRKLKNDLEENSISTWLDEDELTVGDSLLDKLEEAISESSHFLIIVSPNSVESQWVKYELSEAIKSSPKIIPIVYKTCIIPQEIAKLCYLDLSNEIVERRGDLIEFVTDGYKSKLAKLVKDLKTDKYKLTREDKTNIQDGLSSMEENIKNDLERIHLKVVGYTVRGKIRRIKSLKQKGIERTVPVMMPPIFKEMKLKQGDVFQIVFKGDRPIKAHLAGYRSDNLKIVFPKEIVEKIGLEKLKIYSFEANNKDKLLTIL